MEGDRTGDKSEWIEISSGTEARQCRQVAQKMSPPPKKARKSIFMRAERTQSGTVLCASVGVLTAADVQGGYSDALTEVREVCHSERQGQVSQKER